MSEKHFFRATLLIAIFSFLSRVLGLLRSTLLAAFYGATQSSGLNDCYTAAFKLPDIIFNLVAAGSISIVLIPYFTGLLKKEDKEELNKACSQFLNFFFILMSFFLLIAFFFAPIFVKNFLVTGWENNQNILLTIKLTRILLLQVLFITLSGIFGSYLNAIQRFAFYSFAMLSYNVGIIIGVVFFANFLSIEGVVWGVVLGGILHFLIQMIGGAINGFKYYFSLPKFDKDVKELFLVAIPRIIAISGDQIIRFFLVNFASFIFIGSIFIFDNVENIGMIFYGIIAVSISTTAFPIFVKLYNECEFDKLLESLFEKLRGLLFFILPLTILMIIFKKEIVEILLGYNKFGQNDILITADALMYYLIGIPFLSITIIVVKFYYSQKKSLVPMIIALISIFITITLSYYMSKKLAVSGLSFGRSIGFIVQAILLLIFIKILNIKEKKFSQFPKKIIFDIVKIVLISTIILIIGLILHSNIQFSQNVKLNSLLNIFVFGSILGGIYFLFSFLLKIPEIKFITKKIFKKN